MAMHWGMVMGLHARFCHFAILVMFIPIHVVRDWAISWPVAAATMDGRNGGNA